jgi:hypothetical protein
MNALRAATLIGAAAAASAAMAADPIKIGLVTALSGQSAKAGEALTRGLTIAIDEINAKGGLLGGRKLELVRRDDEAVPARIRRRGPADVVFLSRVLHHAASPAASVVLPLPDGPRSSTRRSRSNSRSQSRDGRQGRVSGESDRMGSGLVTVASSARS